VDHSIDANADGVHLIRHAPSLVSARDIAENDARGSTNELGRTGHTRPVPGVRHHLLAATTCRAAAKPKELRVKT